MPYRADDAIGTILVGSALTVVSGIVLVVWAVLLAVWPLGGLAFTGVVAVPSLVLRGYLVVVVDNGVHNESVVPSFVRWGSLVRTGATSSLISTLYILPGAVLCGVAIGGVAVTVRSPPGFNEAMQALTGVLILISGVGVLVYGLVYLYIRPAAQAVFAGTDSLRAALQLRRVGRLAATDNYLSGWLITMGVLTVWPAVLLPLFGIVGGIGFVSPTTAILLMLATALFGIGLVFVVRVSAAWATGRAAADGFAMLYPMTTRADSATGVGVIPNKQPLSKRDGSQREVDPAVQTGRTVEPNHAETNTETPPYAKPTGVDYDGGPTDEDSSKRVGYGVNKLDTDAEGTDTDANDGDTDAEYVDTDAEDVDTDAEDTDSDAMDSQTDVSDSEFIWGVDEIDSKSE